MRKKWAQPPHVILKYGLNLHLEHFLARAMLLYTLLGIHIHTHTRWLAIGYPLSVAHQRNTYTRNTNKHTSAVQFYRRRTYEMVLNAISFLFFFIRLPNDSLVHSYLCLRASVCMCVAFLHFVYHLFSSLILPGVHFVFG